MSQRFTGSSVTGASINFAGASAHTVCGWVYVQNDGAADVCYLDPGGGTDGGNAIWLGFEPGNWRFQDRLSGVGYDVSIAITTSAWTHLALTWDGTSCRAYINGALVNGPTATVLATRGNMNHLDIGFGGDLTVQGVMAFTSALTQAQIQAAMQLVPPISSYAWYKLENAAPTTDSSGNSHTLSAAGDANGAQLLVAGTGSTVTAGSGTLNIGSGVALVSTASATVTAASGTLSTPTGLASTASATVTGACGTLATPTGLASTASATVTGASGTLNIGGSDIPLVSVASATITGASGTLSTPTGLVSTASATVTGASGTLATLTGLVSIASATVTGAFGILSGGTPVISAIGDSHRANRRFAGLTGRRAGR